MSTYNVFYLSIKPFLISKPPFYSQSPFSNTNRQSLSRPMLLRCSNHEREEERWLREEQRWLREEQRWLREESRWHNERDALLRTISALKLQIKELKPEGGKDEEVHSAILMSGLSQITEVGSGAVPLMLEEAEEEERERAEVANDMEEMKKRGTLRSGSEGEDVRELQEALQKVGFYCGEEDEEFCFFSSGTERAVKTWQASLGVPEDGIMTAELQERLYTECQVQYSSLVPKETVIEFPKEDVNGAAVVSVTDISEVRKKVVEDKLNSESDVTNHRVFLLGENRWEEPSRLIVKNKADGGAKTKGSATTCLSCRGVGRVLCAECDGSGDPNIEEQFLEWVDEGMKCPYCEGHGFTTCDVCNGEGEALV